MIFNDFRFLFIFLPLLLVAAFFVVPSSRRRELLLGASLVFYGFSGLEHAAILVAGLVWIYALTRGDAIVGNTWRLTIAAAGPLAALFYYKYTTFVLDSVQAFSNTGDGQSFSLFESVLLPAGISFFTFQMVSFAIDRYKGGIVSVPSFRDFALYVSFFPQLVAGPILRYQQVEKPIAALARYRPSKNDITVAIGYVVFGLFVKVLLADGISLVMAPAVAQPAALGVPAALYVVLGYSFQIYFDFYGYSLVAIGLGRMFGFQFPDNFLRPYSSDNPRDFWRRWHVSLSNWIRDYLYLPLGGNHHYIRNIAIVFAVCGLWHGAGWNFIVWGLYHGALVAGYSAVAKWWDLMPTLIQRTLNFTLVSLGWLLFLFDFQGAADLFTSLVGLGSGNVAAPGLAGWLLLGFASIVCFAFNIERSIAKERLRYIQTGSYSIGLAMLLFATVMFFDRSQTFIYFRF